MIYVIAADGHDFRSWCNERGFMPSSNEVAFLTGNNLHVLRGVRPIKITFTDNWTQQKDAEMLIEYLLGIPEVVNVSVHTELWPFDFYSAFAMQPEGEN